MSTFSIIEVSDSKWASIVNGCLDFDFYHTQSYHLLELGNRPVLFVAYFKDYYLALPLIIENIPGTDLFDCKSVYGYCGPISNVELSHISDKDSNYFKEQLLNFLKKNKIVTVFSRLHPLICSKNIFNDFGTIVDLNKTIALDLRLPLEDQIKQYRKSTKYEIKKLKKINYEVVESNSKKDIDAFIEIYYETMDRVKAAKNYYFEKEYFYSFLENKCFDSKLLLVKKDGEIISGAIFTINNKIMQYHLAGNSGTHIKESPMKIILDQARIIGSKLDLDFLHLGGGVGGKEDDFLFKFKSGFSDYECQYKVWKFIVDQKKYNELNQGLDLETEKDFFPLYRK